MVERTQASVSERNTAKWFVSLGQAPELSRDPLVILCSFSAPLVLFPWSVHSCSFPASRKVPLTLHFGCISVSALMKLRLANDLEG